MKLLFRFSIAVPFAVMGIAAEDSHIAGLPIDASAKSASERLQPRAAYQQPIEYVIPELIIGGELTSTIKLTNRSSTAIPPTNVYFMDNSESPMTTTFQTSTGKVTTDVGFSFSLQPGGIIEGTFLGGSNTVFGHAFVVL